MKKGPLLSRFWEKVQKGPGCWLWIAYKMPTGYGRIWDGKHRARMAHRISWEIHKGPIPSGLCVLHRCDEPAGPPVRRRGVGRGSSVLGRGARAHDRVVAGDLYGAPPPLITMKGPNRKRKAYGGAV